MQPAAGVLQRVPGPDPRAPHSPRKGGVFSGCRGQGRRETRQEKAAWAGTPEVPEPEGSASARVCAEPTPERGSRPARPVPSGERGAARPGRRIRLHLLRAYRSRGSGFSARGRAAAAPPGALRCSVPAKIGTPTAGVARVRAGRRCQGQGATQAWPPPGLPVLRAPPSPQPGPSSGRPAGDPRPSGPTLRHSRRRARWQHLNF